MFAPNNKCLIQLTSGDTDVYGQPKKSRWVTEGCSIVKLLITANHTPHGDTVSGSRGAAVELESHTVLLLGPRTGAQIEDIVQLQGYQFRINGKDAKFDGAGRLDHYEITAAYWRKT